jgi:hypothetical protein
MRICLSSLVIHSVFISWTQQQSNLQIRCFRVVGISEVWSGLDHRAVSGWAKVLQSA